MTSAEDTNLAAALSMLANKLDVIAAKSRTHAQGLMIGWAQAVDAEKLADVLDETSRLLRQTIVIENDVASGE